MKPIRVLLVALGVLLAVPFWGGFSAPFGGKHQQLKPVDGLIKLDLKGLRDGKPHYYKVTAGGKEVKFFVLVSDDGTPRTAFDACDVCYKAKKGYGYEGDYVICLNCGSRFHETKINVVQGGCNPVPLDRSYDASSLVVTLESLGKGTVYF